MTIFLIVVAIIGLIIFLVGGVLHLISKPYDAMLMVIGGMLFAVAQVIMLFDVLF